MISIICTEECNSYGMWSRENKLMGFGVYYKSSYFNHSCKPNVIRQRKNTRHTTLALVDIPKHFPLSVCYSGLFFLL